MANRIVGKALQSVTCQLAPGQTVYAEPGSFCGRPRTFPCFEYFTPVGGNGLVGFAGGGPGPLSNLF